MIDILGNLFKGSRGCLYGKTQEEKDSFFSKLIDFNSSDPDFFKQQLSDLRRHEKVEFNEWLKERNQRLRAIRGLVGVVGELLKQRQHVK